jgi:hypothetical protein
LENYDLYKVFDFKSMDVNDGMCSMLEWMYQNGSSNCYNCGWHPRESSLLPKTIYMQPIFIPYGDYGINAMNLEEFEKCMFLDSPPPETLHKSYALNKNFKNSEIARILSKMKVNFINTWFNINSVDMGYREDNTGLKFLSKQRLSNSCISPYELDEISTLIRLNDLCSNNLSCEPSSIITYHSLYDVCSTVLTSEWVSDANITFDDANNREAIHVRSAFKYLSLENIKVGDYILHINMLGDKYYYNGNDNEILTVVTGSDAPVIWNRELCYYLSNNTMIMIGGVMYPLLTVSGSPTIMITKIGEYKCKNNVRVIRGKSKIKVNLPNIDTNSIFQTIGLIGTKWSEKIIDTELTYRIIVNAMTGKKSIDSLMTYIAGLTATRYSVGGKLVDLTNLSVQNSIPELTYALVLMCDQKSLREWCKFHYINIDSEDTANTIYRLFTNKIVRLVQELTPELYSIANDFITTQYEICFKRDLSILKTNVTADFQAIQPFIYLDSKFGDVRTCETIDIIGLPENVSKFINIGDTLKCGHVVKTTKTFMCDERKHTGWCPHSSKCPCCGNRICEDKCLNCFDADDFKQLERKVIIKDKRDKKFNVNNKKIKLKQLDKKTKRDKFTPGTVKKIINLKDEKVKLPSIKQISVENFFFFDLDSNQYCFYNCMLGTRVLSVEPIAKELISNEIKTSDQCLLHCIARQTGLTVNEMSSITSYKKEHSVLDAIKISKYFYLNMIIQISKTSAQMIRYGAMEQPYILIAHSDSTETNIFDNQHWFIPHNISINNLPKGFWMNMDLADFNVEDSVYIDVFYCDDDDLNNCIKHVRNVISMTTVKGLESPDNLEVTDVGGELYLTNSNIHNVFQGHIKIKIPIEYGEIFNDVFNSDFITTAVNSITANTSVNDSVDDIIDEEIHLMLQHIAICMDNWRNNEGFEEVLDVNGGPKIFEMPKELKVYKALEIIKLTNDSGASKIVLTGKKYNNTFVNSPYGNNLRHVQTTRASYGSMIRQLIILLMSRNNVINYESAKIAKCIEGIAGSGKTFDITSNMNDDTLFTCKFRRPVDDMKKRNIPSKTLEHAPLTDTCYNEIVIDEAGAASIVDMVALCTEPNLTFKLYGDRRQITLTDFSNTPGLRDDLNILEYHKEYIETWNESHRYGQPYIKEVLSLIYPNARPSVNVTWETTHNLNKMGDLHECLNHLNNENYDIILTFHSSIHKWLTDNYLRDGVIKDLSKCSKVHADQGIEGRIIAVLYWSPNNSPQPSGILSNIKYITTALTRCKYHCEVITNFNFDNIQQIIYTCSKGSGNEPIFNVSKMRLRVPIDEHAIGIVKPLLEQKFDKLN